MSASPSEDPPEPKIPNAWNIHEPFQYAPTKPDGDPWLVLLEPLQKRDKIQCDAWREEVQNLLIFAGLFSAVVTAFINESYKDLQPDPNDAIVALLSHIAARLDSNPLNSTASSSQASLAFSPTSSSIRVNAFWFISLVLSLTTVLIGITSLQWLREHESYPEYLLPKQIYAIFSMRAQALEKWHVNKIFMALPVLLQCAVVLFLAGMIDFLLGLNIGNLGVVIPVSTVIGFALFFIAVTTLSPTIHLLAFPLFNSPPEHGGDHSSHPPVQCPYKSPQSHAFRTILKKIYRLSRLTYLRVYFSDLMVRFRRSIRSLFPSSKKGTGGAIPLDEKFPVSLFHQHIIKAFCSPHWVDLDLSWLQIRDAFMRHVHGRRVRREPIGWDLGDTPPIHDIIRALKLQSAEPSSLPPAYYCLADICDLVLCPPFRVYTPRYRSASDYCLRNAYLHDLLAYIPSDRCLSEVFNMDRYLNFDTNASMTLEITETGTLREIMKHQNLFTFLCASSLRSLNSVEQISIMHTREISLRLLHCFHQTPHTVAPWDATKSLPQCLGLEMFNSLNLDKYQEHENFTAISVQFACLALAFFRQVNKIYDDAQGGLPLNWNETLYAYGDGITMLIHEARFFTLQQFDPPEAPEPSYAISTIYRETENQIRAAFHSVFRFVEESLNHELAAWSARKRRPSLLFYTASLYTWNPPPDLQRDPVFASLSNTLSAYKERTIDAGIIDKGIEEHLRVYLIRVPWFYDFKPCFSKAWWKCVGIRGSVIADEGTETNNLPRRLSSTSLEIVSQNISPCFDSVKCSPRHRSNSEKSVASSSRGQNSRPDNLSVYPSTTLDAAAQTLENGTPSRGDMPRSDNVV